MKNQTSENRREFIRHKKLRKLYMNGMSSRYFKPSLLNRKLQAIFPSRTDICTETGRWVPLLD